MQESVWQALKPYLWFSFTLITWQRAVQLGLTLIFSRQARGWEGFRVIAQENLGWLINMQNDNAVSVIYYIAYLVAYHALLAPVALIVNGDAWTNQSEMFLTFLRKAAWSVLVIAVAHFFGKRRGLAVLILSGAILIPLIYEIFIVPHVLLAMYERYVYAQEHTKLFSLLDDFGFSSDRILSMPGSSSAYLVGIGKQAVLVIGNNLNSTEHFMAIVSRAMVPQAHYYSILESVITYFMNVLNIFMLFYVINRPCFYKRFGFSDTSKVVPFAIGMIFTDLLSVQLGIMISPIWNYINWKVTYFADSHVHISPYWHSLHGSFYDVGKATNFANAPLMSEFFGLFNSHMPTYEQRSMALALLIGE